MFTIDIDPVIFSFGHFSLRWYSLIVGLAVLVGVLLAYREARRKGLPEEIMDGLTTWVLLSGIAGARLFHVLDNWRVYAANPLRILFVWEGGLAIWGAVIGGFLAVAIFAWRRGLRLGFIADTIVPGLVLAQALGRVACIITGDAVGKPTTGPLGLAYLRPGAMVPQLGVFYAPMPLYEIVANLVLFAIVWRLRRKDLANGTLFLTYLGLYGVARFAIGFTSVYQIVVLGLTQSQILGLVGVVVSIAAVLYRLASRRRGQRRPTRIRALAFAIIATLVLGVSGLLIKDALFRGPLPALAGTVIDIDGSMAGFSPAEIRVPLGEPVTIRLTSLDSPLHKGGGKHQLAIDEFGVDIRAAARESASATFTPDQPGTYTFYCDVCCGGRSSPSMQGKFVVEA